MPKQLPAYCNPNLPQARRLTQTLRALDSSLVGVWNGASQSFQVWGPSKLEGMALLLDLTKPDGTPIDPDVYPSIVLDNLFQRQDAREFRDRISEDRQRKELNKRWEQAMDSAGERAKYVAKAVAQERTGTLRYGLKDVFAGLRAAEGNG